MIKANKFVLLFLGLGLLLTGQSCRQEADTLFTEVPASTSHLDFSNQLERSEDFNILDYLYYYNGGGVAAGDIDNDGRIDLYFTANQGTDRLYLNRGDLQFEEITEAAGVGGETGLNKWTTGATMVDINADGFLDIYVCEVDGYKGLEGKNRLYINQGDATFREAAADYGLDISAFGQQATFFDADLDGDLDCFLLNHAVHTPNSYKKAEVRKVKDQKAGDRFFINEDGKFRDVTEQAGIYSGAMGYGLAVSIGDLNDDGFPDIYISNDFHENDYLYLNNGDGTFRENIAGTTGHVSTFSMGNDIADFDNDGRLDIVTADMKPDQEPVLKASSGVDPYDTYQYKLKFGYHYQYSRNMLHQNRGLLPGAEEVRFSEIGQQAGIAATDWSWGPFFADFDNNGYKDLFITNGIPTRPNDLDYIKYLSSQLTIDSTADLNTIEHMPSGVHTNFAFANDGAVFTDRSRAWGLDLHGCSNGAAYADLDNDGDLDLVVNNFNHPATLFRNGSREKHQANFLTVELRGSKHNPDGIGVRIELFTEVGSQLLENHLTRGWLSGTNLRQLHFGLGAAGVVDSLCVRWPGGRQQTLVDLSVNQTVVADYRQAKPAGFSAPDVSAGFLQDCTSESGITFQHKELPHNGFAAEKLMPHLLSTEGPALAVADVDGDGLEDFYVGGGKGQPGELYLQQAGGKPYFRKAEIDIFASHWMYEDTGSAFFDADGDGDQDLYVVSGGGERSVGAALRTRLYLNDGRGRFTPSTGKLPVVEMNGSCVVPFDANGDGQKDLFIGNRSVPGQYGLPGPSRFLLNRGNGEFIDATVTLLENQGRIGMVTDAVWLEERKELIIVGEWMPVTVYSFRGGNIQRQMLDGTSGWWNRVEAADIDGDGDRDLLLGNTGQNTNLSASAARPLDLYVHDFDGNLSTDPLMAYYKNDTQWVYPGFDLLAKQLVGVKNKFRSYKKYANSPFSSIFPPETLRNSYHVQVQTLESGWLEYEDGYRLHPLPAEAQIAPIYGFAVGDFDADPAVEILAAGNFYGNPPSMGRSDASFGVFINVKNGGRLEPQPLEQTGFAAYGEVRDMKVVERPTGELLILVARNNRPLQVFLYSSGEHRLLTSGH